MADHTSAVRYGQLDHDFVASLRSAKDDGPFLMLNLMRYREWADYGDDRPRITGQEADDAYAPIEILHELGAQILFFGTVAEQLAGEEGWHRVAVVRYPSVSSFLDMQERPDFIERHVHKDAGMERTIISLCHPVGGEVGTGQQVLVDLSEADAAGPGLHLHVAGTPVGDGRAWRSLRIAADDVTPSGATAVSVVPLLNLL